MAKKKEIELKPIIEKKDISLPNVDLSKLDRELDINTILDTNSNEDNDSFFKSVVTQLFNDKDVETKTYNTGTKESFYLARLSFLGDKLDIPSMKEFVKRVERKRISIGRKGRIELVSALVERQQELERIRLEKERQMLGGR